MLEGAGLEVKRLSKKTIERIQSAQVILDLQGILKELLENSIDSKATVIKIVCCDYGIEWIEVSDDGQGIDYESLFKLCSFGGTSKIREYEDIGELSSFGFRGEGLAAIRHTSNLEVTTRLQQEPSGYKALYSPLNDIPEVSPVSATAGTSIKVKLPFSHLPAKRQELVSNARTQFRMLVEYVQTYALILTAIKFEFFHVCDGSPKTIFNYGQSSSVKSRINEIYGFQLGSLIEECTSQDTEKQIYVTAYCSNLITSGSLKNFNGLRKSELKLVVNQKPASASSQFRSLVERVYTEYNQNAKFFVLLFLTVPKSWVDFNLSKDKREIRISNFDQIRVIINSLLESFLSAKKGNQKVFDSTKANTSFQNLNQNLISNYLRKSEQEIDFSQKTEHKSSDLKNESIQKASLEDERDSDNQSLSDRMHSVLKVYKPAGNFEVKIYQKNSQPIREMKESVLSPKSINTTEDVHYACCKNHQLTNPCIDDIPGNEISKNLRITGISGKLDEESYAPAKPGNEDSCRHIDGTKKEQTENTAVFEKPTRRMNIGDGKICWIKENRKIELTENPNIHRTDYSKEENKEARKKEKYFGVEDHIQRLQAEDLNEEQTKFLQKNFDELGIIGQFNRGFIICKWREGDGQYFIVDQHAAAEKFNYEKLVREAKFNTQMLLFPLKISVSSTQCLLVEENLKRFSDSGFRMTLKRDPDERAHEVHLTGIPEVFSRTYTKEDFYDLLYLIGEHGTYVTDLMMPKLKRDMASKACKQSIKIGDSLTMPKMREVVKALSGLQHPWNCPHGRPTTIISSRVRERTVPEEEWKEMLTTTI
jgi:DNA mismatch repair protein PMS2